jgi:hypothetical protein
MESKKISGSSGSALPTDFLELENDMDVMNQLDENGTVNALNLIESIIFSAEIIKKLRVKHNMIFMLTNLKFYILGRNQRRVKKDHKISELYAITHSLIQQNPKFILHIQNRADFELNSDK